MAEALTYRFVDEEPTTYKFVDEPQTKTLPANAGLANFGATILGMPVDAITSLLNSTEGFGQVKGGGLTGKRQFSIPEITNPVGGSQWIKQKLRDTGIAALNPDNPNPDSQLGSLQYDITARGGFMPGGVLPAAGSIVAEKVGGPAWAGVGALLPQAGITSYNAMRAPSLARQEAQNAVKDATFKEGQEAGYVVPPSAAGGGFVSRRLESIGGKAAVGQEAAVRNQKVTNELARVEAGLPENSAISVEALKNRRNILAAPYRELRKIDPAVSSALDDLQQTRSEATGYWQEYARQGTMASRKEAVKLDMKADALESQLDQAAIAAGKPDLLQRMREARIAIAKTHDVERALNVGTGDVSASVLGQLVDKGRPLTGGLATAGKFQQAFPSYMRDGPSIPTPGVSRSEAIAASLFGLGGYSALGPAGMALAALPLASGPTRSLVLSRPYQAALSPSYGPALMPTLDQQLLLQMGLLAQ